MPRTILGARAILSAHKRIGSVLAETPLINSVGLSRRSDADVWLKLESNQPTGSFKVRGALNKLSTLAERARGIVTGSAGNHGLGVAFAANMLGIEPTTIFVPETAPAAKVDQLRQFEKIDLRFAGSTYEHAHQEAIGFSQENGAYYIHAYDDEEVIAGQGTIGIEIMHQLPETEVVIVPVGGGGLIAGVASVIKELSPSVRILGVQASASPSAKLSLQQNTPLDPYDHDVTVADGLAGGFGAKPFYLARTLIDDIEIYSERSIRGSVYELIAEERIVAEPSGAISVAPLMEAADSLRGKKVVCIISGSNIETKLLRDILNEFTAE